ncbi:MAG: hypothetical protein ACLP1X_03755 [Polyangiaceae bacterium]
MTRPLTQDAPLDSDPGGQESGSAASDPEQPVIATAVQKRRWHAPLGAKEDMVGSSGAVRA